MVDCDTPSCHRLSICDIYCSKVVPNVLFLPRLSWYLYKLTLLNNSAINLKKLKVKWCYGVSNDPKLHYKEHTCCNFYSATERKIV